MDNEQLKRIADAMEEVLRLVKKDQQDTAERIARLQEKEKADEGNFADGRWVEEKDLKVLQR